MPSCIFRVLFKCLPHSFELLTPASRFSLDGRCCCASLMLPSCSITSAVPLGVLQANAITFSPALPLSKQQSVAALGNGNLNKICLQFERQFWGPEIYFGIVDSGIAATRFCVHVHDL